MKHALLLTTLLVSLSACVTNDSANTASLNWGNMYTHNTRIATLSAVTKAPAPKVQGKSLINPGIY